MSDLFITYGGKRYDSGLTYGDSSQGEIRFDLGENQILETLRYLSGDGSLRINRAVISGGFSFNNGTPSGEVRSASLFSVTIESGFATEFAQSYNFNPALTVTDWLTGYPTIYLPEDASSANYFYTNSANLSISRGQFIETPIFSSRDSLAGLADMNYFPNYWWQDPFNFSLTSSPATPASNPSIPTTLTTTTAERDTLIGDASSKDTFNFSSAPAFGRENADHITNFVAQGKLSDKLAIGKSVFGISATKVSLKKVNSDKALNQAAASKSLFVYDKRDGGLYLNADGKVAGFGDTGGLFAILDNRPELVSTNLQLL